MTDSLPLLFVLALAAAGYFAFEWRRTAAAKASGDRDVAEARTRLEQLETLRAERDAALSETKQYSVELAAERSANAARAVSFAEKEAALVQLRDEVEKSFLALAAQALDANQQRFLAMANETFEKHRNAAQGGVKEVLAPVKEAFAKLSGSVDALEKARLQDKSALGEQMRQIGQSLRDTRDVTGKLVNALRASPKARGRWGEQTLRNVLELAGLAPRVDFNEQTTVEGDAGRLRPDVLINLPGGRCIVVDSKVALSGYLDAIEATDEATREAHLRKHAAEVRAHVKNLSSKDYWKHVPDTADFVVLFVPGENFLAAAAERDPNLFEDAFASQVIIVTPATMVALAKSVAYGWRQEDAAKNAQQIADLGRELYRRLMTMSEHMGKMGDSIGKSVQTYNALLSSMETRVFPQARRFKDLGAADAGLDPPALSAVEVAPRLPAPQPEAEAPTPSSKKKGAA
jgi:DNA recombination protein RmuC